jgi:hypothetical protein
VSFTAITLCVASQRVLLVVYFVIDSVLKYLDTPSYVQRLYVHARPVSPGIAQQIMPTAPTICCLELSLCVNEFRFILFRAACCTAMRTSYAVI